MTTNTPAPAQEAEFHLNELLRLTQPWPGATIPCATVRSHVEQALSKLRAPVADERVLPPLPHIPTSYLQLKNLDKIHGMMRNYALAALANAAATDRAMLQSVLQDLEKSESVCSRCGHSDSCADMDVAYMIRGHLKGDASAPADEPPGCPTYVCRAAQADGVLCANDECDRANGVRPASAPVAGEAQPVAWMVYASDTHQLKRIVTTDPGDTAAFGCLKLPLYAAPQASEAVRQQRAGDVVALLVYKSKGRPGAHGQTLGANGAGEFAVLYRGDEFAALVKANEEIRALEAAGHRLDFAAIIHGEGYSGPMLRQEYVTRAALSAQPAQKEQSDE